MIVTLHAIFRSAFSRTERGSPSYGNGKRLRSVRKRSNLDLRFNDDAVGKTSTRYSRSSRCQSADRGRCRRARRPQPGEGRHDSMAELVPSTDRFSGVRRAVNMPTSISPSPKPKRAIKMGDKGVQTFTNIPGHPHRRPRFRPFFAAMAKPPTGWIIRRAPRRMPDYTSEPRWRWRCGVFAGPTKPPWMCRLVFDGIYDGNDLKIVTHHLAGGMIPFSTAHRPRMRSWSRHRRGQPKVPVLVEAAHLDYSRSSMPIPPMFGGLWLPCGISFFGPERVVLRPTRRLPQFGAHQSADGLNPMRQSIRNMVQCERLLNIKFK